MTVITLANARANEIEIIILISRKLDYAVDLKVYRTDWFI